MFAKAEVPEDKVGRDSEGASSENDADVLREVGD
jgi:hypothetical protein